jgi:hypothetical protein
MYNIKIVYISYAHYQSYYVYNLFNVPKKESCGIFNFPRKEMVGGGGSGPVGIRLLGASAH